MVRSLRTLAFLRSLLTSPFIVHVGCMDVAADGRVLLIHDEAEGRLVKAFHLDNHAVLWNRRVPKAAGIIKIHEDVAFMPVRDDALWILDMKAGNVLRRYPVLDGVTKFIEIIPGD